MNQPPQAPDADRGTGRIPTRRVAAWAFWDWGSAAYNAITVSFVFTVYLTKTVGADLTSRFSAATWLSITMAISGLLIACTAPIAGRRADTPYGQKRALAFWTMCTVAIMALMYFVAVGAEYFAFGLVLLAVSSITFQLAEVSYFALLRTVSTPKTLGRVSGIGWAAGYVGGVLLLILGYAAFIAGDGTERGFLNISTVSGENIRLLMLFAAAWYVIAALPILIVLPHEPMPDSSHSKSLVDAYREIRNDLVTLYRKDPACIRFLFAAAIYRDGLAGIFTFGAVLAVSSYGIPDDDILIFGVAVNVVAAIGAAAAGYFDDRWGPKIVIICALTSIFLCMIGLIPFDSPTPFWALGLAFSLCIGPVLSASRTFLVRITPVGQEGAMFGLYATTGRAVSFLGPCAFALGSIWGGSDKAGFIGLALVIALGLVLFVFVPTPTDKALSATDRPSD